MILRVFYYPDYTSGSKRSGDRNLIPKGFIFLITGIIFMAFSCSLKEDSPVSGVTVKGLLCEYASNPVGLDNLHPRLSWQLVSKMRGERQTAYQIIVSSSLEKLSHNKGDLWNSGKVITDKSVLIKYQGRPLHSRQRCYWKVRIWDKEGKRSAFSDPAFWEMGLLQKEDWRAQWISAPKVFDWNKRSQMIQKLKKNAPPFHDDPSPLFRKNFHLSGKIRDARIYIAGLGFYELTLNGIKIRDHILDPAFTDYTKRVFYVTYDVTQHIREGDNTVGIMLGNGWYNMFSRGVWSFDHSPWRNAPSVRCQVEITYNDGNSQIISTDSTWKCAPGPVVFNSIRQGETYDATREKRKWDQPDFDDSHWYPVRVTDGPKGRLVAQNIPPVRILKDIPPLKISKINDTIYVADFGQNMAGFIKINVKGKKGRRITFKYGEILNEKGRVDQRNIDLYVREERFQKDIYIMKGEGQEVWHPHFTYHGFRYVEITGFPEDPNDKNLRACIVHTAFDTVGTFACSNTLVQRIQNITLWSYVNNFVGYPTDCPQREKNGWLGDAALACETGLYNFRSHAGYEKWINDIWDSQRPDGSIPPIVPTSGWGYQWNIGPAYDNAIILIPWYLYLYSGDKDILIRSYPAMKKYFKYYYYQTTENILDLGLGDWCYARTQTSKKITSTAYFFLEAKLLAKIARIVGKKNDAQKYSAIAGKIKKSFRDHFLLSPDNSALTQTALGCILYMGLTDSLSQQKVLDRLVESISSSPTNLDFGMIGAKTVINALAQNHYAHTAYKMITSEKYPGWGYFVKQGATTLWETWNGQQSRDHILFGDVSAWFYKYLAGLTPDEENPGFKHFRVKSFFPEDMKWVSSTYQTLYGDIRINWEKEEDGLKLDLTVPVNITATVWLPVRHLKNIFENGKPLVESDYLKIEEETTDGIAIDLGGGAYHFFMRISE